MSSTRSSKQGNNRNNGSKPQRRQPKHSLQPLHHRTSLFHRHPRLSRGKTPRRNPLHKSRAPRHRLQPRQRRLRRRLSSRLQRPDRKQHQRRRPRKGHHSPEPSLKHRHKRKAVNLPLGPRRCRSRRSKMPQRRQPKPHLRGHHHHHQHQHQPPLLALSTPPPPTLGRSQALAYVRHKHRAMSNNQHHAQRHLIRPLDHRRTAINLLFNHARSNMGRPRHTTLRMAQALCRLPCGIIRLSCSSSPLPLLPTEAVHQVMPAPEIAICSPKCRFSNGFRQRTPC